MRMGEEKEVDKTAVSDEEREMERIREKKMREMEEQVKANKEGGGTSGVIDHPVTITDSTFVETVKKYPLVVIDCWAQWCGPCRMVAPIIEELAKEYAGKIVFGKLNVDENPRVSTEFAIMAIPTIFIFKNGEPVDVVQGAMPKPYFEAKLKEWL
jgi:thioredoxin 1